VLFARGDLKKSRDSHRESLAINQQLGDPSGAAYDKYRIAEVLAQNGDLRAAESSYRESIKEQTDAGLAGETSLRLASLLIDMGRAAESERVARAAEETLRVAGAADLAAWVQTVVADSESAQGQTREAKADLEKARPSANKSADNRVKVSFLLVEARIAATSREKAGIEGLVGSLVDARQAAAKGDRVIDEFELRLATSQLEFALGRPNAAGSLKKLATEARARGLEGIAKKADAAVRKVPRGGEGPRSPEGPAR
jgi:ATP/maltotriose-dependent transcriptional regulator MalT